MKITGAQNGLFVANEYIVNVISGTTFSLSQNAANPTLNTITTNGVNGGATFYVERSLTLGGGVSVNTANATSAITFGNSTAASTLNLQMGGADRTIDVAAGESLSIINAITGANALTKSGNGTLLLGQGGSGNVTVSNFNALHITGGTVIVTGNAGSGSAKGTPLSGSAGTGTITMDSGTTLTLSSAASPYNPIFMNATGGNVTLKGGHSAELAVEGGIFGNGTLNIVGAPNNAAQIDGVQLGGSAIANTYVGNIIVYNQGTVNGTVSAGLAQLRLGAMPFGN